MAPRPRFDPKRPLVAARDFTFMGVAYAKGDPFNPEGASDRLRARQYEARVVNFGEGEAPAETPAEQVTMTGPAGGRYTITAPWLAEPEVVRGKVNAEKRLAELQTEGPPVGFIEGGSAVTVEGGEGGWYAVDAPWLDEPEKLQGREAAEARQRELHEAGEPDTYKGVTLTAGENGWYAITREGVDVELKVHGEDAAREAAAKVRAGEMVEGQPAEWTPAEPLKAGDVVLVGDDGGDLAGQQATIDSVDGDQARVVGFVGEGDDRVAKDATVPLASLTAAEPAAPDGDGGEQDPPPGADDNAGEGGEQGGGPDAPEGGQTGNQQEDTVDTQKDPNERAEELGNQPNAAEQAADEQRAGTEGEGDLAAGSGERQPNTEDGDQDGDGSDGGDGTARPVGP